MPILLLNKSIGKTPLETIHAFKKEHPSYKDETISYAGRLDPMAEGLLLLLVGEENKKRQDYEHLTKTYEFTVLLGVETDTYDILGRIVQFPDTSLQLISNPRLTNLRTIHSLETGKLRLEILHLFSQMLGKQMQIYPPYSSKTVHGKPLYWWARQGKLHEVTIPVHEVTIESLSLEKIETISNNDLRTTIRERITKVQGDFRQEEILMSWDHFFDNRTIERTSTLLRCSVTCSSGTYVRGIAHEIGKQLGCGALALAIKRTRIGDFTELMLFPHHVAPHRQTQ